MAAEGTKVGRIKLGSEGLEVSAQGLGCMGMSAFYGPPKPDSDMVQLIHHAINSGVTFLDTSDVYGPHTNEILLGKVLNFLIFGIFSAFYALIIVRYACWFWNLGVWAGIVVTYANVLVHKA